MPLLIMKMQHNFCWWLLVSWTSRASSSSFTLFYIVECFEWEGWSRKGKIERRGRIWWRSDSLYPYHHKVPPPTHN